jgi:hypothetical protein
MGEYGDSREGVCQRVRCQTPPPRCAVLPHRVAPREKDNILIRHSKRETERSGGSDLEPRFRAIEGTQRDSKSFELR